MNNLHTAVNMMKMCILLLIFPITVMAKTVEASSLLTDQPSQNKTFSIHLTNRSSAEEINHLQQQLNQETIIRLSLTKQLYSLVSDVISMKTAMAKMESRLQKCEQHINPAPPTNDDTELKISRIQRDLENLTSDCFNAKLDKDTVVFNAVVTKPGHFERNTPVNIIYDKVLYDTHNAYSIQTGAFTAPMNGLYVFTWSTLVAAKKILDAELLVNGIRKGLGNCNNEANNGYENCSNTVPVLLQAGDEVSIRSTTGNYIHGHEWSSFKGWRT